MQTSIWLPLLLLVTAAGWLTDSVDAASASATAVAGRQSTQKSPAELQTMLLIMMQQTFEMTHHLAAVCNRYLQDLRNRNERDFLSTVRDIGINQDFAQIETAFLRLADEFSTGVKRKVGEQQKSGHAMMVAFERQVFEKLPLSRESADSHATVQEIHELWQRNDDIVTERLATDRAGVQDATKKTIERGWALYKESKLPQPSGAEEVNWQKRLERMTAELVVQLHKLTEDDRLAGVDTLLKFEEQYSDKVKHLITIERGMLSEELAKKGGS